MNQQSRNRTSFEPSKKKIVRFFFFRHSFYLGGEKWAWTLAPLILFPLFTLLVCFSFFFFLSLVQEKLESIHFETPLLFFTSFTITPSIIYPVTSVIFFFLLLLFFFFFRTLRLFFFFSDFSRIALVVRTHTNYRKGRKKNTFFFWCCLFVFFAYIWIQRVLA